MKRKGPVVCFILSVITLVVVAMSDPAQKVDPLASNYAPMPPVVVLSMLLFVAAVIAVAAILIFFPRAVKGRK